MKVQARNLSILIDSRKIIADLSFEVDSGASLAIVGPSGCGKTTLLNAIGGLIPIDEGHLLLDGEDAIKWRDRQRRAFWRSAAAFVLQDYGLVEGESVAYNVQMTKPVFGSLKVTSSILGPLEKVGLGHRVNDPVVQLSGGERRRVSLARAIYKKASIIFADEPTASLDEASRQNVQDLLLDESHRGTTVLIATHDKELARACDATIVLH